MQKKAEPLDTSILTFNFREYYDDREPVFLSCVILMWGW